ncbi:MAG: glycosyltransferase, partial [Pseudomonadota bacterium]
LRRADIVVLPSYVEGMPNALIEAMAAAVAVVGTNVGAVADVIDDGVNGFIVEPRQVGELLTVLHRLVSDESMRNTMGAKGRLIAEQRFSTERAVRQLVGLAHGDGPRR